MGRGQAPTKSMIFFKFIFNLICQLFVATQMRISGWGSTGSGKPLSPQLRTALVTGLANTVCQANYNSVRAQCYKTFYDSTYKC